MIIENLLGNNCIGPTDTNECATFVILAASIRWATAGETTNFPKTQASGNMSEGKIDAAKERTVGRILAKSISTLGCTANLIRTNW